MDKPYTGLTASVQVAGELLAYISGVDLDLDKEIIEILAFGMQYKEKVPAVKDWSASVDGTVALAPGNTQAVLFEAFESGVPLTIGVFLDDNNYFEGTAFVQSFNISGAPDDKINLSSELSGSGAVILTLDGISRNASVYSNRYIIDQIALTIVNVPGQTDVETFSSFLVPATGATFEVQESGGTVKASGDMVTGDKVEVTAEDGVTVKTYIITVNA